MDGFTYHNIFETKGIEYIAILVFFALFIPFWLMLTKKKAVRLLTEASSGKLTAESLNMPGGIYFSRRHTWSFLTKTGMAKTGLDDLLVHLIGDVRFRYLKNPGDKIKRGDIILEATNGNKILRIQSPLTGEIAAANTSVENYNDLKDIDLYEKGWMYMIKPANWKSETADCYLAEDAATWARSELTRFKDFVSQSVSKQVGEPAGMPALQDGGELIDNPLSRLPAEVWDDFQVQFLGLKREF